MKAVICTIAFAVPAAAPGAHAEVPPGPDAINGAFERMLARRDQTPVPLIVPGEPDTVAVLIADALQTRRLDAQALALRD